LESQGSFLIKTFKELSSKEVVVAINVACTLYTGNPCPGPALAVQQAAAIAHAIVTNDSADVKQGALRAPPDYQFCKAQVNAATGSISGHATFNGTLQDDRQQLAYYIFARKGGGQGESAEFNVYYSLWKKATGAAPPQCMTDGPVFECGEKTKAPPHDCFADQPGGRISIQDRRPE
jgi:hypothetical protein